MPVLNAHMPVMTEDVLRYLEPKPGQIIIDCTVGAAGHSEKILQRIIPGGRLIGMDLDEKILETARARLKNFEGSFFLREANFKDLDGVLNDLRIDKTDGFLFDLGLSSYQLASAERGFSFTADGPLDMRMGRAQNTTACQLVNFLSKDEIADILFNFSQERYSRRIAQAVVRQRKIKPIRTTAELKKIILGAVPKSRNWQKIHPATRAFQALRIAVNDELAALEEGLKKAAAFLSPGGRICVISFHSLEDRIVKNIFRDFDRAGMLKILTKKPVYPAPEEIRNNPRARSAKLRAALKIKRR